MPEPTGKIFPEGTRWPEPKRDPEAERLEEARRIAAPVRIVSIHLTFGRIFSIVFQAMLAAGIISAVSWLLVYMFLQGASGAP